MVMTILAAGAITTRSLDMMHHSLGALAFLQADSINSGNSKLLMIFIGIAAFALLAQAIVLTAVGIGSLKAVNEIKGHIEELKGKAMPLIANAHTLVTDLTPEVKQITTKVHGLVTDLTPEIKQITTKVHEITVKVEQISGHFEEIAGVAKDKVHEFGPTISEANVTIQDANRMTREQVARMNSLVTEALNATEQMGASFRYSVGAPAREIAHLVDTAKETLNSFVSGTKSSMDTLMTGTKGTVDTIVHGTKGTVDSIVSGTKGTVDSLVNGIKGLADSWFAAKKKPSAYRPAAYRSNPAVPNPPVRTGFADETKFPTDY